MVSDNDISLPDNIFKEADYILYTDISPTKELHNKYSNKTFIFDHHISSKYTLGELDNYYFELDKCGAEIFFYELTKYIKVKPIVNQFIELVSTLDLWQENSPLWKDARNLHNVLFGTVNWFDKKLDDNTRYIPFMNKILDKFIYADSWFLTATEKSIASDGETKEQNALSEGKKSLQVRKDSEENLYIYFECVSKISFVANMLLKEYGDRIKYCVGYSTFDKNKKSVSLRSVGNFDCSHIAKMYGGGGHKNASGIDFTKNNEELFNKFRNGEVHLI
jgi:oligoribonuclease NrnB/cAMP/cGMP phosphodiesterase (DHH superfamily)